MKIFISGNSERTAELEKKLGSGHDLYFADTDDIFPASVLEIYDIIFDLNLDEHPMRIQQYAQLEKPVIACAVKNSLASMCFEAGTSTHGPLIGLNALPTFIEREKAEVSVLRSEDKAYAEEVFSKFNWPAHVVEDRVGMVTPRIIFMIINEAFYTVQEGTATAEDIDKSMKLGTNYPYGPFEWCERVGIENVYQTLEALYQDTHDERYKICPMLKKLYLKELVMG